MLNIVELKDIEEVSALREKIIDVYWQRAGEIDDIQRNILSGYLYTWMDSENPEKIISALDVGDDIKEKFKGYSRLPFLSTELEDEARSLRAATIAAIGVTFLHWLSCIRRELI
ncbi:MAG: hypothetical protein P1U74_04325 [Legionellaceae bacterium]|nr:hypothetical protein [Legionellaceae bacterium]